MLSIKNEASSSNELDSQAAAEILEGLKEEQIKKDKKEEDAIKMEPNFKEIFSIMGEASGFLCKEMETYNATLNEHVKLLSELNACVNFIDTRTSQLKELRNFVRRRTTSLDQIFPLFFNYKSQIAKTEEKVV